MHYRTRADEQSYAILAQKADDPRWNLHRLDIAPDPRSRFHDPYSLDCPPLPPDDPEAHQYMHCVDGKKGWKHWHDFGQTMHVENPNWPVYLGGEPLDEVERPLPEIDRVTLDKAIELGLLHSREYQEHLEDVYLSALALTYDRFRFQVRANGLSGEPGTDLFYEHQPDDESNLSVGPTHFGLRKMLPTGAQIVTELANHTIWLFSGSNSSTTSTTFSYLILQPLLRNAGREIALEDLTQAERNVLYAIRRFARFRKDFYVMVVTGDRAIPLPGSTGGSELAFLIRGERSPTVGFYYLLFQYQRLRNRTENVRSLEMRLRDVQAMERDGTATSLDVTQVQTSLEQARFSRTIRQRFYGDELDRFKLQLGLPPDLEMTIDDSLLAPFELENEELTDLERQMRDLDRDFAELANSASVERLREVAEELNGHHRIVKAAFDAAAAKLNDLQLSLDDRVVGMTDESAREFRRNVTEDAARFEKLQSGFTQNGSDFDDILGQLDEADGPQADLAPILKQLTLRRNRLSRFTRRLNSLEGAVRVELIELKAVHLTPQEAVQIALGNRLDLMNRRALVMDARRRLEIAADALEGTVDIVAEGEVSTPPLLDNDRPFNFRADESEFRVGVRLETPLDRRRERNNFRAAQVAYQRARRNYMAAEDQVKLDVRNELRDIRAQRELFEIQRRALRVAARELEQALDAGEQQSDDGNGGRQQGLNIPRALENILDAQDELIEAWVEYETARLKLYRDMDVMQVDQSGVWPEDEQRQWATTDRATSDEQL